MVVIGKYNIGSVAKLAYAMVLEAIPVMGEGSSPFAPTNYIKGILNYESST